MPRRADSPAPPTLANFRGSEEYRVFLEALAEKLKSPNMCDLIERCVGAVASQLGMIPPPRTRPVGWNRYTDGPEALAVFAGLKSRQALRCPCGGLLVPYRAKGREHRTCDQCGATTDKAGKRISDGPATGEGEGR
jgi:hypothetical protein